MIRPARWLAAASVVAALLPAVVVPAFAAETYEMFDAGKFSNPTKIDNAWFPIVPGTRFVWEGSSVDEEGDLENHSIVFTVTDLTKVIGGVEVIVCLDRDFVDGELEEQEIIFFAQDDAGAVWHLGEYPEEYDNGTLVASPGWVHGFKGWLAGVMMPADPKLGDPSFAQGLARSIPWTDRAIVYKVDQEIEVPAGTYTGVLVFDETNEEEPNAHQYKYYARGVGNIQVGWAGEDETQEVLKLVSVDKLSEKLLADARELALGLDERSRKTHPEEFGKLPPAKQAKDRGERAD